MPLEVVSGVGRGMGVLDGRGVIVEWEGALIGVNLGHPIVTCMGTSLHSCARTTRSSQITLGGLVVHPKQYNSNCIHCAYCV